MDYNRLDKILEVCGNHNIQLVKRGGSYWAKCPLHGEKTASLQVKTSGHWHCFGCDQPDGGHFGDAIDLQMKITGQTFVEAKVALGLADGSYSEIPKKKRYPNILKSDDKKECWQIAKNSLCDGFDVEIVYKGTSYWNHEFVARCLHNHPKETEIAQSIYRKMRVNVSDFCATEFLKEIAKDG